MGIHGSIHHCTDELAVIGHIDMIAVGVFVTLRVAEVYQVQLVRMDSKSNCCILWLNILVDNIF